MASALTLDRVLAGVNQLPEQLINHELQIRDIEPQNGPVHNKRRQLARVLFDEYSADSPPKITAEKTSMDLCKMAQFVFAAHHETRNRDQNIKLKAINTLEYIRDRLMKTEILGDFEKDNAHALLGTIKSVLAPNEANELISLNDANEKSATSVTNESQIEEQNDNLSAQINNMNLSLPPAPPLNNPNSHAHMNDHNAPRGTNAISLDTIKKISKWNIKFTNDNKMTVFEFIDKVEAKAKVYGISEQDLFRVASEFFEGFPSKWYKSSTFNNWAHLKEMLVRDFVGLDYSDNLLQRIRERKQTENETVLQFFTDFEDECSRLVNKLPDKEKIRILKLNVLQSYRPHIALVEFHSVNDIKKALQILENTMPPSKYASNRYTRFGSNDRSNSSQNFGQNNHSSSQQRSRYDKHQSKYGNGSGSVTFNSQNNRSFSNTSRDNSAQRQYQSTNHRSPTPHNRFNSQERQHSKDRSQSRDNSTERYPRPNNANKPLNS